MPDLLPKLPPGADVVFRRLFDDEDNARLLISLLNGILRYPPGAGIKSLTLRPTHVTGLLAADKEVILDIRAESESGRQFHIEVQVTAKPAYAERILFYWAELYCGQLETGKGYTDLCPVVSVHFLFFDLLDRQRYPTHHHIFRARADGDDAVLSPHFELHTLEMRKFADRTGGSLEEKWLYFLKHGHELSTEQTTALGVPEITEAERKLVMISQSRDLRVQFERRMKAERDAVALTRDSLAVGLAQGLEKGLAQGLEKGLAQGLEKGLAQGLEKGLAQGLEKGKSLGIDEGKRLGVDEGKRLGVDEGKRLGIDEGKRLGIDEGANLGKQEALRDAVLQVLSARGIAVSAVVRDRIAAATDLQVLQSWLVRASVASRAEDILIS